MKNLILNVVLVCTVSYAGSVICPAQEVSVPEPVPKLHFDVSSVKQNKTNDKPRINVPPGPGNGSAPTDGIFSATAMPLVVYLMFAYNLTGNQMRPLMHQLPEWATTDVFDIDARAEDPNTTKDQMRLMMQSLLADRFKIVVHKQMQQVPALGLVVAKAGRLGPRLQQHSTDVPCTVTRTGSAAESAKSTVAGGFPGSCGTIAALPTTGLGLYAFGARDVSIRFIADILGAMPELGRPVVDETGLAGTFDFRLEFTPQMNGTPSSNANPQTEPIGTTFLEAVEEQLGLKLEPRKSAVEVFIVDHVEHPSSN